MFKNLVMKKHLTNVSTESLTEFIQTSEKFLLSFDHYLALLAHRKLTPLTLQLFSEDLQELVRISYEKDFHVFGELVHAMDSSLERVYNKTHLISDDLLHKLFLCCDQLKLILQAIRNTYSDQAFKGVVEKQSIGLLKVSGALEFNAC